MDWTYNWPEKVSRFQNGAAEKRYTLSPIYGVKKGNWFTCMYYKNTGDREYEKHFILILSFVLQSHKIVKRKTVAAVDEWRKHRGLQLNFKNIILYGLERHLVFVNVKVPFTFQYLKKKYLYEMLLNSETLSWPWFLTFFLYFCNFDACTEHICDSDDQNLHMLLVITFTTLKIKIEIVFLSIVPLPPVMWGQKHLQQLTNLCK